MALRRLLQFSPLVLAAAAELIFHEKWENFDQWTHEVTGSDSGNNEFQIYRDDRKNSWVKDGILTIKATRTADEFGEAFLTKGVLDHGTKCNKGPCVVKGTSEIIVPPVLSARIVTKSKFSFKYGKVEFYAKMPAGDWLFPAIWFLPEKSVYGMLPRSGEIDLIESLGNEGFNCEGVERGRKCFGTTMHWGSKWNDNYYVKTHKTYCLKNGTLADKFHKYTMEWTQHGLKSWIDDILVLDAKAPAEGMYAWAGRMKENPWVGRGKFAPFDQEFHMLINVAVGGTKGYMPDEDKCINKAGPKPWENKQGLEAMKPFDENGYKTWTQPTLQVKEIKIWNLKGDSPSTYTVNKKGTLETSHMDPLNSTICKPAVGKSEWYKVAAGHTCGDRIWYLQSKAGGGKSEAIARKTIASQHPAECSTCDIKLTCEQAYNDPAFSANGRHTCGQRIDWLKSPYGEGKTVEQAYDQIATEYPHICGVCKGAGKNVATAAPTNAKTTTKKPTTTAKPTTKKTTTKKTTTVKNNDYDYYDYYDPQAKKYVRRRIKVDTSKNEATTTGPVTTKPACKDSSSRNAINKNGQIRPFGKVNSQYCVQHNNTDTLKLKMFWHKCVTDSQHNNTFVYNKMVDKDYGEIRSAGHDDRCWSILRPKHARKHNIMLKRCKKDKRQMFVIEEGVIWLAPIATGDVRPKYCVPFVADKHVRTRNCYISHLGGQ